MDHSVWQLAADDLFALRGRGGTRFTEFVDALLRAEARVHGIAQDQVATNIKTSVPDGGVDSEVLVPAAKSPGGWLSVPTCWQLKGTDASALSDAVINAEVTKPYAARRIGEGFGYRLAICDDVPPAKRQELEQRLATAVQQVSPDAQNPRILFASDLVDWALGHPAIIVRFFRPYAAQAQAFVAWEASEAGVTAPPYNPGVAQQELARLLASHLDFAAEPPSGVVFTVGGQPGSGRTRAVLEAVRSNADMALCVPGDEAAVSLAITLSNDPRMQAVLVVDPCSGRTVRTLDQILRGHAGRVRCVAILSNDEPALRAAFVLKPPSETEAARILRGASEQLSEQRAQALASITAGDLRAGVETARIDPVALDDVNDLLDRLLERHGIEPPEAEVLEALSLANRVGYARKVQHELADLCSWLDVDAARFVKTAQDLQRLGIVAVGGLYLSVKPPAYARVLSRRAWTRWARRAPEKFLAAIPPSLEAAFLGRIADHAAPEARDDVSQYFWNWASISDLAELQSEANVARFAALLEIHPERYLPVLSSALSHAPPDVARGRTTGGLHGSGVDARRRLVDVLERLTARASCFDLVEGCLFTLARLESEPSITNNASGTWAHAFASALSGSPLPFRDRLTRLQARAEVASADVEPLMQTAFQVVLSGDFWRLGGPAIVAGELRPTDWEPKSWEEYVDCRRAGIELVTSVASRNPLLAGAARSVLLGLVRTILREGPPLLQTLKDAVNCVMRRPDDDSTVLAELRDFLAYDSDRRQDDQWKAEVAAVEAWRDELKPIGLVERATALLVATPMRDQLDDRAAWAQSLDDIGAELVANRDALLEWLSMVSRSEWASSGTFDVGKAIGNRDRGALLTDVAKAADSASTLLFFRGYLLGVLETEPDAASRILQVLQDLEGTAPSRAFDLFVTVGSEHGGIPQALRMLAERRVRAEFLRDLWRGHPTSVEVAQALRHALDVHRGKGDGGEPERRALGSALDLFAMFAHQKFDHTLKDPDLRASLWDIVDAAADGAEGEAHWWGKELRALAAFEPDRAVTLAIRAYLGSDHGVRQEAEVFLTSEAQNRPESVLMALEPHLLEKDTQRRFLFGRRRSLVMSLPAELLIDWVKKNGVPAATVLAAHLPPPSLGAEGQPIVPPLTEFILREFEAEEGVFDRFCSGVHNLQLYRGDIAGEHDREKEEAQPFFSHELRRVREWANREWARSRGEARWWREHEEELFWSED